MKKGIIDPGLENPKQITNLYKMEIVTVTCTRDKYAMLLQAHSIHMYVTAQVKHWVIIQDSETTIEEWYKLLKPFYKFHSLEIIPSWLNSSLNGWNQQQILKFESVKFITSDIYFILDSKNLFIKNTDLSEVIIEGHRHYIDTDMLFGNFKSWYDFILDELNVDLPKMSWVPQTLFTASTTTINKLLSVIDLEDFYIKFFEKYPSDHPSEFLLYRFFSEAPCNVVNYQYILWDRSSLENIDIPSEVICLGIHRNALLKQDYLLDNLKNQLVNLNFDTNIVNDFLKSFAPVV